MAGRRSEAELELAYLDAVKNHRCVADPEVLEFMQTLELGPCGLPTGCGVCEHIFRKGEKSFTLWVTAPYDSWGVGVCARCHGKYGDRANLEDLHR